MQFQTSYPLHDTFYDRTIFAYVGNVLITSWRTLPVDLAHPQITRAYVENAPGGDTLILFNMTGVKATGCRGCGIYLDNVNIRKITKPGLAAGLANALMMNSATQSVNSVPGNRVVFQTFLNFLCNFDRFQYYIYHRSNFSFYSWLIINNTNQL